MGGSKRWSAPNTTISDFLRRVRWIIGSPVVANFTYGVDGTTVGDLTAFLESLFTQSTVAFDPASSEITVTADDSGEASLSLALSDGPNQAGGSSWSSAFFAVTTNGAGPDTVTTSAEVFDTTGAAHVLTYEYVRQSDGTWNLNVSLPRDEGTARSFVLRKR